MKLKKALSQRIKALREAAGLSQQDVAVRGDLSLSLVAKLEQGKKADPRASTLLALAQALAVKPGQLLDDLLPPSPPAVPGEGEGAGAGASEGASEGAAEAASLTNGPEEKKGKKKKKEGKKKDRP